MKSNKYYLTSWYCKLSQYYLILKKKDLYSAFAPFVRLAFPWIPVHSRRQVCLWAISNQANQSTHRVSSINAIHWQAPASRTSHSTIHSTSTGTIVWVIRFSGRRLLDARISGISKVRPHTVHTDTPVHGGPAQSTRSIYGLSKGPR